MPCMTAPKVLLAVFGMAASLEDDSALVQGRISAHQTSLSSIALQAAETHRDVIRKLASGEHPHGTNASLNFDCAKYPLFCKAPYNCQSFGAKEVAEVFSRGMAVSGKPNLRVWCLAPAYYKYVTTCVAGDLVAAGKIQYQWSIDQKNGVDEMDGSYCFLEGHCNNPKVTNRTTMEEAIDMCDKRYGHDEWTKFAQMKNMPKMAWEMRGMPKDSSNGFKHQRQTTVFLKAACAMGNYHCDVVYCKETYCKKPYYIKKYSHLQSSEPIH